MKRCGLKFIRIILIFIFTWINLSCSSTVPTYQQMSTITPATRIFETTTPRTDNERGMVLISKFIDKPPYNQNGLIGSVYPDNTAAFFDFDDHKVTNSQEADIYLAVSCGSGGCDNTFVALDRPNGTMVVTSEGDLGYQGCIGLIQKEAGTTHIIFGDTFTDTYLCVKTNKGNIVQLHVTSNEQQGTDAKVTFDYVIWYINN